MELNKTSLSDSSFSGVSSTSISQLHALADKVYAQKVTNNCEDSGYHSSRNIANSDIYASNATYMQPRNQEINTMQSNDDKEMFQSSLLATHDGHNLIPRSVCSSSFRYIHQTPFRHAHDMNQADLDGNANHIHSNSKVLYDPRCISLCKNGGVHGMCSCSNFYPSAGSNIQTSSNKKQFACQVTSTNCNCKRANCHAASKSHSYSGNNLALANGDFKSETSDLAEKIEFCLLFGYTVNQIQLAIFKLGYRASKNDILAELSCMQNSIRASSVGDSTSESSPESSQGDSAEHRRELLPRGAEPGVDSEVHHSHILIDEEDKDDEDRKDSDDDDSKNLRPIVIDGSNVAMSHGNKQYFSCKGILLAVNYFRNRNHTDITVFVPQYRKEASRHDTPIKDREILTELEKERILVFTPSRNINGKRVTCYDDRFILKLAQETNAVIVSNDNFRDLQNEKPEWKTVVEKRLLMYSFVNDRFMPPDDPLGRNGPNIDNFLRIRPAAEEQSKPQCPYGKKCTYGKKCKFFHPECPRPVSERIVGKKSDNNRKKSKFSLALAAELIQRAEQSRAPSTSASSLSHQDISMENVSPALRYQFARNSVDNNAHKQMPASKSDMHIANKIPPGHGHEPSNSDCMHSVMSARLASMQEAANVQRAYANPDNLSESFRQMSVSSHRMVQQSKSVCCAGHPNVHVCYDPNPFMNDKSQISLRQCPRPEPGPPDYHADNHLAKHAFQRSSPANLQQGHAARSAGNPVLQQQQQWNVASPYPTNPHLPAQFALPPYLYHQSRIVDSHYPPNQSQPAVSQQVYRSYQMPPHSQGPPPVHAHFVGAPLYVTPVNTSTGSNNSLSRSFPYIPSSDRPVDAAIPQNFGSSSSHSDPHGYSFRSNLSSRHHHHHGVPHELSSPNHSPLQHAASAEPPLSSEKNPRFYLYRNLCGLFQRPVVEAVMKAHPDVKEPNKIIALIKQMIE